MHYQHCTCLPTDIQMWWCTLYHFQCVDSVHKHAKSISGLQKGSTVVATFKALHCLLSPDCGMIQDKTESPSRLEASAAPVQALPTAANSPYNQQSMLDTAPNSIFCTCKKKSRHILPVLKGPERCSNSLILQPRQTCMSPEAKPKLLSIGPQVRLAPAVPP